MARPCQPMPDTWQVRLWRRRSTPRCLRSRRYVNIADSHLAFFLGEPLEGDRPAGRIEYSQAREQGELEIELLNSGSLVAWLRAESAGDRGQILSRLRSQSRGALLMAELDSAVRRASVLVYGESEASGNQVAVLLGSSGQEEVAVEGISYRYGDLGAALRQPEHAAPHLGAMRVFCELFLGLSGQEAVEAARGLWSLAEEHVKVQHKPPRPEWPGGHFVYLVPAAALAPRMVASSSTAPPASCIDALCAQFRPNAALDAVALVLMKDLLCSAQEGVMYAPTLSHGAPGLTDDGRLWLRADMLG